MACYNISRMMSRALTRPKPVFHLGPVPCRLISSHAGAATRQYLIQVPDFPDIQEKRMKTKQTHIQDCTPLIENGKLSYFGVTLSSHPQTGEAPRINGSIMVLEADNEKVVRDFLERDAYTKAGVWNVENAQIWPFKSG